MYILHFKVIIYLQFTNIIGFDKYDYRKYKKRNTVRYYAEGLASSHSHRSFCPIPHECTKGQIAL